jgi:hypothetical protein
MSYDASNMTKGLSVSSWGNTAFIQQLGKLLGRLYFARLKHLCFWVAK